MDLKSLRLEAIKLFDSKIIPHILGDLNELDKIQPSEGVAGCTVPTAMVILSALDFIGFLIRPQGKLDETKKNIEAAIQFKNLFPSYYNNDTINKIVVYYRHGMMHSFYPKQTSTEIYAIEKSIEQILLRKEASGSKMKFIMNVNVLSKDFRKFVEDFYQEIIVTTDYDLINSIISSFKEINPGPRNPYLTATTETTQSFGVNQNK